MTTRHTQDLPRPPASTCPACGRTTTDVRYVERGWCQHCNKATAPEGIHRDIVTIRIAARRARQVAGDDTDSVADFVRAFAGVLEVCSTNHYIGSLGHAHIHAAALDFLAATSHLEGK